MRTTTRALAVHRWRRWSLISDRDCTKCVLLGKHDVSRPTRGQHFQMLGDISGHRTQTIPDKLGTRANTIDHHSSDINTYKVADYLLRIYRIPSAESRRGGQHFTCFFVVSAHYTYYHWPSVVACAPIAIGMSLHTLIKRFRQPRSTWTICEKQKIACRNCTDQ